MDFEVQRCTRRCCATDRELQPDETFYSALVQQGGNVVRQDYCAQAWEGPPENSIGWWKSKMPGRNTNRLHWAPNDIMLDYFEQLENVTDRQDVRYVLSLLLVRRRVMRHEDTETDENNIEWMIMYCPKREANYRVQTCEPDSSRVKQIQEELAQLLFADAA